MSEKNCVYFRIAERESKEVRTARKAAKAGDAEAQYRLAYCYYHGKGVEKQSREKATYWFRKAATQGHVGAQFFMGFCYEKGQGVVQSDSKAASWYVKATAQGDEDAQHRLRNLQRRGGV